VNRSHHFLLPFYGVIFFSLVLAVPSYGAREKDFIDGLVRYGFLKIALEESQRMIKDPTVDQAEATLALASFYEKLAAIEKDPETKGKYLKDAASAYGKFLKGFAGHPKETEALMGHAGVNMARGLALTQKAKALDEDKDDAKRQKLHKEARKFFGKAVLEFKKVNVRSSEKVGALKDQLHELRGGVKRRAIEKEINIWGFREFISSFRLGLTHYYNATCDNDAKRAIKKLHAAKAIFYDDLAYKHSETIGGGYASFHAGQVFLELYKRVDDAKEKAGFVTDGVACFEQVIALSVTDASKEIRKNAYVQLVNLCKESGRFEKGVNTADGFLLDYYAEKTAKTGKSIRLGKAELLLGWALKLKSEKELDKAEQRIVQARKAASEIQSEGPPWSLNAAEVLKRIEDEWGSGAKNVETEYAKAMVLYLAGKHDEAIAAFQLSINTPNAAKITSITGDAFWNMAACYTKLERSREAAIAFAYLSAHFPKHPRAAEAGYWAAIALLDKEHQVIAPEYYRSALETLIAKYPESAQAGNAKYLIAEFYYDNGDFLKAAEHYGKVPESSKYFEDAKNTEAVAWYQAFLTMENDGTDEAKAKEALALLAKAREHLEAFIQWVQDAPMSTYDRNKQRKQAAGRSKLYLMDIYLDDHINAYDEALAIISEYEAAHPDLAQEEGNALRLVFSAFRAYIGNQDLDAVDTVYTTIETKFVNSPQHKSARVMFANLIQNSLLEMEKQDAKRADVFRQRMINLYGQMDQSVELKISVADMKAKNGRYKEAAEDYKQILKDYQKVIEKQTDENTGLKGDLLIQYKIAKVYCLAEEWQSADEWYDKIKGLDEFKDDLGVMQDRIMLNHALGQHDKEREILIAIKSNVSDKEEIWTAKVQIAQTYLDEKNFQRALELIGAERVRTKDLGGRQAAYVKMLQVIAQNTTGDLKQRTTDLINALKGK